MQGRHLGGCQRTHVCTLPLRTLDSLSGVFGLYSELKAEPLFPPSLIRFLPDGTQVRIGMGPKASQEVIPIPRPKEETAKIGLCKCTGQ